MAANQTNLSDFQSIAIVAHDAGAAEVLSAFVKRHTASYQFCLDGPAVEIFKKKLGEIKIVPLADAMAEAGVLLCGSGWQTDLELDAIRLARTLGKRSICWLDHWVNYRNRFERDGVTTFPDEVWVSDAYAEEIARRELLSLPVHRNENPYIQEILAEFEQTIPIFPALPGKISLLYLCEPIGDHAATRYGDRYYWGYTENEALQYFLGHLRALGENIGRVLIRPHPSENAEKYKAMLSVCSMPVIFSSQSTLLQDLASSDCVVGSNSMAMFVAQTVGKRVVSCIPPGGAPCSLPHLEIEDFSKLVSKLALEGFGC